MLRVLSLTIMFQVLLLQMAAFFVEVMDSKTSFLLALAKAAPMVRPEFKPSIQELGLLVFNIS